MDLYTLNMDAKMSVRYMGYVTYSNPWMHFTRTADEFILYILQSGSLYLREGEKDFVLRKGDIFLLDPFVEHTGTKASCCDYYFIHFRHEGLQKLSQVDDLIHRLRTTRENALKSNLYTSKVYDVSDTTPVYLPKQYAPSHFSNLLTLLDIANSAFYTRRENYRKFASIKLEEFFLYISQSFADTLMATESPPTTMALSRGNAMKRYLDTHYTQKITSHLLESIFNANYNYLNRSFKSLTGLTIMTYLNQLRIEHAKAIIASSSTMQFADVGYLVGIDDPYYFSKLFKKHAGQTATEYAYSLSFKECH